MKNTSQQLQKIKEKQNKEKQILLNNIIDQVLQQTIQYQKQMEIRNSKDRQEGDSNKNLKRNKIFGNTPVPAQPQLKKDQINLMDLFDLLIWAQKKQPQLLNSILQMDVLKTIISSSFNFQSHPFTKKCPLKLPSQNSQQIKAYIVLINNSKVNGTLIIYLLNNGLVDEIMLKYLKSIQLQKERKKNYNISDHSEDNLDEKLQYLGSFLKAYNSHLNQRTYKWFLRQVNTQQQSKIDKNDQPQDLYKKNEGLFDIIGTQEIFPFPIRKRSTQAESKQCLLVSVCCSFYNCPEELTKTCVLNILMGIFGQTFARQLLYIYSKQRKKQELHPMVRKWSYNLCCQFRNQLKNFSQQLCVLKKNEEDFYLQEINDRIILWEDLTSSSSDEEAKLKQQVFSDNFTHFVIYCLIVGSLNTHALPMFNIKFAFFSISKLMTVILNLDLLRKIGDIFFIKNRKINYRQSWISTAVLKGFNIGNILNQIKTAGLIEQDCEANELDQKGHFEGTSEFFLNMLRSKDQHFLLVSTYLIQQIIVTMKKASKLTINYYISELGFGKNGFSITSITSVLLSQLKHDHSIDLLCHICEIIIYIQPDIHMSDQNSNEFVYFYQSILDETLTFIDKGQNFHSYLIETFEYDMRNLNSKQFKSKVLKDSELLIYKDQLYEQRNTEDIFGHDKKKKKEKKDIQKEKDNTDIVIVDANFYSIIPQTPSQILRYRVVKIFVFMKFKQIAIQLNILNKSLNNINSPHISILEKYVQRLRAWQEKKIKPGHILDYPLKQNYFHCKVIDQKIQIPCVLIQDDTCLIIGFSESNHIKVMINVKLKHISCDLYSPKKDKNFVRIQTRKFDQKSANLVPNIKNTIFIKDFPQGVEYFNLKISKFKQRQLQSIKKGLNKLKDQMPAISLL